MRPPLTGYCSWYQKGQGVQPDDIRRALRSFSGFAKPPGGHTIQLDDGYQVSPGDWSGRGAWKDGLDKLPGEIKAGGFIPGIWIAPTAIHASHPIVSQHPEWLQRNAKGEFCITFHNWKAFNGMTDGKTYFLEPDHPEARQYILKTLRDLRARGWDYFKIDFAYTVSSDRVKYDPAKTTYESLRDQWKLFREGLGGDAIINSCNGGMWRYTIGQVDISRLGGDIGGSMQHLRRNLAEMMLRCHANGVWFQADPDVFYLREEKSDFNFEQSHLLTATQGLLGTAFLTSDFADQWSKEAIAVAKTYWNANGPRVPAMLRVILQQDGLPAGFAVAHGEGAFTVALYNWDAQARDISIRLADLRLPGDTNYTFKLISIGKEPVAMKDGMLTVTAQPGESLRAVTLRAAPPRAENDAVTPRPYKTNRHDGFMKRKAAGPIDMVFLGDSITDGWPRHGRDTWEKFAPHQPANFGISGMRTEGLLWNITHGELDGITPKVTVILIGVNNLLQCPDEKPEWTAAGIRKVVATVREKTPDSKILVMGVFPARNPASHPARARIAAVNALVAKLDDREHIRFLDIGRQFLDAAGLVRKDLMPDGLHPNAKGYQVWCDAIEPVLSELRAP